MAERTIDTAVTFKQPAAFHRTWTLFRLPAIARAGGASEVVPVDPNELSVAPAADGRL